MPQQFGSGYLLAQGSGTNYELLRRSHYEVDIQGIDTILLAQNVTLPKYELDAIEVFHYNDRVKAAARPNPTDMRLDILDAVDPRIVDQLWAWFKQIYDPATSKMGYTSDYKRQAKVYLYDVKGNLIRTWTCSGVWPKGSPTPEEAYDYTSQEPVRISLAFSVDRATLDGIQAASFLG